MPDSLTFKLAAWSGPSGRTLIQGVKWDGTQFFIAQADDVTGQTEQDVVIHRHNATFGYVDADTVKKAGHASSFGVQSTKDGTRIWLGHNTKGAGWFLYGSNVFHPVNIPNGDIAVDAAADLLCLRVKDRYRGYILSTVDDPEPVQLFDASIPAWGNRFQGHAIVQAVGGRTLLCVHRDMKTLGESKASWFTVTNGTLAASGSLDTTHMGDEAEGFMTYDGSVWVVKRRGGSGPGRTVIATRTGWQVDPNPKAPGADEICDNETVGDPMVWTRYAPPIHVAASLNELERQYTALFPHRPKASDGALGNASHAARVSDHNPAWGLTGSDNAVIRAVDLTTSGPNGTDLTEQEQRDVIAALIRREKSNPVDRIHYIIHRFPGDAHTYIWSRTHNWAAVHYDLESSMPHDHHFHVSLQHTHAAYTDTSDWFEFSGVVKPKPPVTPKVQVSLKVIQHALATGGDAAQDGREVQAALNKAMKSGLLVDGILGRLTRTVAAMFQVKISDPPKPTPWPQSGFDADADGVLGVQSLKALGFDVQP